MPADKLDEDRGSGCVRTRPRPSSSFLRLLGYRLCLWLRYIVEDRRCSLTCRKHPRCWFTAAVPGAGFVRARCRTYEWQSHDGDRSTLQGERCRNAPPEIFRWQPSLSLLSLVSVSKCVAVAAGPTFYFQTFRWPHMRPRSALRTLPTINPRVLLQESAVVRTP